MLPAGEGPPPTAHDPGLLEPGEGQAHLEEVEEPDVPIVDQPALMRPRGHSYSSERFFYYLLICKSVLGH